ncbi:MAG: transposase [Ignavibacteria bacterium]|nr:transposase [Ignavibacteria bacterium]
MKLSPENIYHIYNRGNNKQKIFFSKKNYIFFLQKLRTELKPHSEIICYCLMPNHFHFMVSTYGNFNAVQFSNGFRTILSSYTKAVNQQENRTGSLFQQNSKAKCLTAIPENKQNNYGLVCFNYIHQNPENAGLVRSLEDWEFSSFRDYAGLRNGTLCRKEIAYELIGIPIDKEEFIKLSLEMLDSRKLPKIF